MSEPSAEQVAFAERWLYLDIREAFPELPAEMVREIADRCAPSTAAALSGAMVHEEISISGCTEGHEVASSTGKTAPIG